MIYENLYRGVKYLPYVQRLFEVVVVPRAIEGEAADTKKT